MCGSIIQCLKNIKQYFDIICADKSFVDLSSAAGLHRVSARCRFVSHLQLTSDRLTNVFLGLSASYVSSFILTLDRR